MKLLFNSIDTSIEFHEILGFVDSTFSFNEIKNYLYKSTKEVVKWIGEENYNYCYSKFENDEPNEFMEMVKYTIALGAFMEYAPLLDISFTDSGRVFRADDHLKSAFEWQIDKSNEALERSYYSSLNEIIMMTINSPELIETPYIKSVSNMYVNSLEVFQNYVNINDSYLLFFKLIPSLKLAEHQLILSRTADKFETYKEDNTLSSLIRNVCVYFAMIDGLKKNSVQLFPHGVIQVSSAKANAKTAKRLDVEATVLYYRDELSKLLDNLESELNKKRKIKSSKRQINFSSDDGFVTM